MTAPRRTRTIPPTPGPTITLTITGGPHLHEFTSFGLQAVRAFDPTTRGRHCLRGPFLRHAGERVPPMNQPVLYTLPSDTMAVYVYAKSAAGAAHDVHAALVPAPGEQVVLPLTLATDEKRADVARLARLLEEAEWIVAHTMPENPHSYSKRETWASGEAFEFATLAIRRYGHREGYIPPGETKVAYRETVFASGSHFVWSGWCAPEFATWINRKALAAPVVATVVDQQLVAHDARMLDIPALPDGFAGLPDAITRCPFFQAGVHLFGYVASDALETNPPGFAQKGMVKPKEGSVVR